MIEGICIRQKQDGAYIFDFIHNGFYSFRCYYGSKRWSIKEFRREFNLVGKHIF